MSGQLVSAPPPPPAPASSRMSGKPAREHRSPADLTQPILPSESQMHCFRFRERESQMHCFCLREQNYFGPWVPICLGKAMTTMQCCDLLQKNTFFCSTSLFRSKEDPGTGQAMADHRTNQLYSCIPSNRIRAKLIISSGQQYILFIKRSNKDGRALDILNIGLRAHFENHSKLRTQSKVNPIMAAISNHDLLTLMP